MKKHNGKTWTIGHAGAFIARVVAMEAGEKVKMIGKQQGDDRFNAEEIRPWGGPGMRMRHK